MSRDQMLCVFVPVAAAQAAHVDAYLKGNQPGLDALFARVGSIHFASFALLPGGLPNDPQPSLMLELVVDPGVRAAEVLRELVAQGDWLLGPLYARCANPVLARADETEAQALTRHLVAHAHGADGGFVGLRDRRVEQIRSEAEMFEAARDGVQRALDPARRPTNSARLAALAVKTVRGDRRFDRLNALAPRSFWRSPRLSLRWRLLLVFLVLVVPALLLVLIALGGLAIIGIVAVAAGATVTTPEQILQSPNVFMGYQGYGLEAMVSVLVSLAVLMLIGGLLASRQLSVTASVASAMLLALALLTALLTVPWIRGGGSTGVADFLGAFGVLVIWGVVVLAWLFLVASVLAFLAWLAPLILAFAKEPQYLGLLSLAVLMAVLLGLAGWQAHRALNALVALGVAWSFRPLVALSHQTCWGLPSVDVAATLVVVFTLLAAALLSMLWRLIVQPQSVLQKLNAPHALPLSRIQQSHPSLEACEAAAVGSTNHMISVTDIRRCRPLTRFALQLSLRAVTFIGHAIFTEGRLGQAFGIKFAHWHVIDEGRRLLFCSNYEGTFGGYLDEFINGASQGINLFWRWTELDARKAVLAGQPGVRSFQRFPPTRLLFFAGCKNEQWFKAYTRASMLPHLYRYEAYRFTMMSIDRATRLRDALVGERSLLKDDQIMRALES